jgi:hypothetical protein
MTKQEFNNALNAIENEYNKALNAIKNKYSKAKDNLLFDYAIANNPCEIGDIIEDHIGKGRIIKQNVTRNYHNKRSSMFYECIALKKDDTPRKKETLRTIYQHHLKSINGKTYKFDE